MPPQLIDLSHTIHDGLITYKGLPAPIVCDYWSRERSKHFYADEATFHIAKIEMVANTGTYIDCPFHRFEDGKGFSDLKLEAFAELEGLVIDALDTLEIGINFFQNQPVQNKAVLVRTDWSRHWNTDTYFENHPFLTAEAAEYLKAQNVKLVGIDSYNIDDTRRNIRPVHTTLLGADILIVEHLCHLKKLPKNGFTFSAVPPKFEGVGSFPVRAFGKINQ